MRQNQSETLRVRALMVGLLLSILFRSVSAASLTITDLQVSDLIFWADAKQSARAGHVAIVSQTGSWPKGLRIAHATDNKKYYQFCETYLPSHHKLKGTKQYKVVRLQSHVLQQSLIQSVNSWLSHNRPFNAHHEKLMQYWDDALVSYSAPHKLLLQQQMFVYHWQSPQHNLTLPADSMMCSEVVIRALQATFIKQNLKLPTSLHLDPILCPPSTLYYALSQDNNHFQLLEGALLTN